MSAQVGRLIIAGTQLAPQLWRNRRQSRAFFKEIDLEPVDLIADNTVIELENAVQRQAVNLA
jgi:hypothetical protein